jgi:hypothetical protein
MSELRNGNKILVAGNSEGEGPLAGYSCKQEDNFNMKVTKIVCEDMDWNN